MVKHSLRKMLDKYPYFLDKRSISNLYKITKVNNSVFRELYNNLFQVYQGFHLNKRLLVWKTQTEPYIYQIHFCCTYPNIKLIEIYKNDVLIHKEKFTEEEKKTDYFWTYECNYIKTNMLPIKVYKCINCNEIYFGDNLPSACSVCGNNIYYTIRMFRCTECGEIYFVNPDGEGNINMECLNGCNSSFEEIYAYRCIGNSINDNMDICGELYLGSLPPTKCDVCGIEGYIANTTGVTLYNDDTVLINDNSTNYDTGTGVIVNEDGTTDYILSDMFLNEDNWTNDHLNVYKCNECGKIYFGSVQGNCEVCGGDNYSEAKLYRCTNCKKVYFLGATDSIDRIECDNGCNSSFEEVYGFDCSGELYIGVTPPEGCEKLVYTGEMDVTNIEDDNEPLKLPFSVIPDDTFRFHVETWDEYWATKGYPENDTMLHDEFDHDYSLDAIGALNNIPRKQYISIDDEDLYFLTEPPFNKSLTEDDYHYMKRMITYNIRLWVSLFILNTSDPDYTNYMDLLNQVGITEEDYIKYKNNTKLFIEDFNPITLELWKKYSINSRLVNREKKILKLFDLRKHNTSYIPYKVDNNNNPIIRNGSNVYKDEWEVVTDLSECWVPQQWEHKDKFCDATQLYGEYFFVISSTLRPVPYENVRFKFILLNGLAELLNDDYYVKISYHHGDKSKKITIEDIIQEEFFNFPYEYLEEKNTNVLFEAIRSDGEYIGKCEVILTPRDCTNSDIYVDATSTKTKQDGSKTYPYKDLQKALDKVSNNLNVIALKSNINTNNSYFVSNNCKIIGCNVSGDVTQISTNGNKFFKLIGGKNCSLTLSNLKLKSGNLSAFIPNATWINSNNYIDYYSSVIISGGWVNITVLSPSEQNSFFPTDIIKIKASMKDKDGNSIANLPIKIFFDGEEMGIVNTDNNGELEYDLSINKTDNGTYDLDLLVFSETYFSVTENIKINCDKIPKSYNGEVSNEIAIVSEGHTNIVGDTLKVFINGVEAGTVTVDSNGNINYDYTPQWGVNVITFVDDDDNVIDMIIVKSILTMSKLIGKQFVKNFNINSSTGDVNYTLITIDNTHKISDLTGVLLAPNMNGNYLEYDTFKMETNHSNMNEILYDEALILQNAVTDIGFSDEYIISYDKLGEFWE